LPTARIGGINIAGTSGQTALKWTNDFIKHCLYETNFATGKKGSPLEAILFHAKGQPRMKDGVVWMNMSPQLRDIEAGIKTALAYPETKNLPLIVGESDPEGCAACGMATNPDNGYRNGTMYSSYTAASFARKYELMEKYQANLVGAVSWSFEFENQPWFYGFRDLATNGVDKPVLNVFRMFGMMKGNMVDVVSNRRYELQAVLDSSVRKQSDIGALASKNKNSAAVMVWNYHDEDKQSAEENIAISIKNIPAKKIKITQYRIDSKYSNSYEAWKKMGSPQQPSADQIALLEKAGQLQSAGKPVVVTVKSGAAMLDIALARQAVVLLDIRW
jgi:xylan 1,4-beta-xylosidase